MRAVIAVAALLILIVLGLLITGEDVNTDYSESDYAVTGLDMRVAVSKDHTYEVEEFISVDIPESLQTMAFAIPGGDYRPEDLTVEGEKAKAVTKSSERYVVIRDPQLLTAGHHRYTITYNLAEPADGSADSDDFSFNIIPQGWKQPVYKVHVLMWFPYGFPLDGIRPYADEAPDVKVTVKREPQSRSFTIGVRGMPGEYDLRLEADLPDGYWE